MQRGQVIDKDELFRSLAKAAPQAEKAAQAVRGLKEAIDGAIGSSKKLGESIAGENLGKNLAGGIDKVSGGIDQLADLNKEKNLPAKKAKAISETSACRYCCPALPAC